VFRWNNKNVYFMGFMATGKSHVGKAFAKLVHWPFLDTDQLIEVQAGASIEMIFKKKGEQFFRKLEKQIVEQVSQKHQHVVALGGGAILDQDNWTRIAESGITVCLEASEELIYNRIYAKSTRPLLSHESPQELLEKIKLKLDERRPYYQKAQYVFTVTDDRSPKQHAQLLLKKLKQSL
jgi:shikimate kinase